MSTRHRHGITEGDKLLPSFTQVKSVGNERKGILFTMSSSSSSSMSKWVDFFFISLINTCDIMKLPKVHEIYPLDIITSQGLEWMKSIYLIIILFIFKISHLPFLLHDIWCCTLSRANGNTSLTDIIAWSPNSMSTRRKAAWCRWCTRKTYITMETSQRTRYRCLRCSTMEKAFQCWLYYHTRTQSLLRYNFATSFFFLQKKKTKHPITFWLQAVKGVLAWHSTPVSTPF